MYSLEEIKSKIEYLGQCGFILNFGGVRIAIDPVLNDITDDHTGKTLRLYPPVMKPEDLCVDYLLCTHEHIDHLALPTVIKVANTHRKTMFIVPEGLIGILIDNGIDEDRIIGLNDGEKIELNTAGNIVFSIEGISAAHPEHYVDLNGDDTNLAYSIKVDGIQIVHLGDTYLTDRLFNSLKNLGKIDVFMLPINGRTEEREAIGIIGNLSYEEAAKLAVDLDVTLTIPTHFDMIEGNTEDPQLFVEALKKLDGNKEYDIRSIH